MTSCTKKTILINIYFSFKGEMSGNYKSNQIKILTTKWQHNKTEFIFGWYIHNESKYVRCVNTKWISENEKENQNMKLQFKMTDFSFSSVLTCVYQTKLFRSPSAVMRS